MAEKQVTIDKITYRLEDLFFVIATQNPLDMEGTYPLPLVQLDRFMMKLKMGYVDDETEYSILKNYKNIMDLESIKPVCSIKDIGNLKHNVEEIKTSDEILKTIVDFVNRTRKDDRIILGASTRSALMLLKACKAFALLNDRDYVIEDDVKYLIPFIMIHRVKFRDNIANTYNIIEELSNESLEILIKKEIFDNDRIDYILYTKMLCLKFKIVL